MIQFVIAAMLLSSPVIAAACPQGVESVREDRKKTETVTFRTTMHCKKCVAKITDNISFVKGVKDLKVNLEDKTVTIKYDPAKTDEETLAAEIRKLGYEVEKI